MSATRGPNPNEPWEMGWAVSQDKKRAKAAYAAIFFGLAGIALTFLGFLQLLNSLSDKVSRSYPAHVVMQPQFDAFRTHVNQQFAAYQSHVATTTTGTSPVAVAALAQRMDRIERAISKDPEAALSLPLLRRDLDALSARVDSEHQNVAAQVDRLYSVVIWILGGVGTLFLMVLGGAGTVIWQTVIKPRVKADPSGG